MELSDELSGSMVWLIVVGEGGSENESFVDRIIRGECESASGGEWREIDRD